MYRHLRGNVDPLKLCPGISDVLKWMHFQDRKLSKMAEKNKTIFRFRLSCVCALNMQALNPVQASSPNVTKGWKRQNYTSIGIWGGLWSQLRPHLTAGWTKKASWDPNTRRKDWAVSQQLEVGLNCPLQTGKKKNHLLVKMSGSKISVGRQKLASNKNRTSSKYDFDNNKKKNPTCSLYDTCTSLNRMWKL